MQRIEEFEEVLKRGQIPDTYSPAEKVICNAYASCTDPKNYDEGDLDCINFAQLVLADYLFDTFFMGLLRHNIDAFTVTDKSPSMIAFFKAAETSGWKYEKIIQIPTPKPQREFMNASDLMSCAYQDAFRFERVTERALTRELNHSKRRGVSLEL